MASTWQQFEVADCLEFESSEYRERWERLREHAGAAADAVLVSSPEALRYFCGYRSLLTRSRWRPIVLGIPFGDDEIEPFLCVPAQEIGIARAYTPIDDIRVANETVVHGHDDPVDVVVAAIASRGLGRGRLGVERGFGQRPGMTIAEWEQLQRGLSEAAFVDASPALWRTREIKSPAEIECLRRACEISCRGVRAGWEILRAGATEREVHRAMIEAMLAEGAEDVWLAIGSGAKGYGVFNSYATDHVLRPGDLVWVDGGAYFRGYICDFIRSAVVGEPSPDQARWYEVALAANQAALAGVKPGATGAELFARAREYLDSVGFSEAWGLDVLGHGVGLEIHELPSLTDDSQEPLRPGHVVTIEPSLSPPGHSHGHYIVEEVVAVTGSGQDVLTAELGPELWIAEA